MSMDCNFGVEPPRSDEISTMNVIVSGARHFVLTELIITFMQLCRTRIMKSAGNDDQISISYTVRAAFVSQWPHG